MSRSDAPRVEYTRDTLERAALQTDPFSQFTIWWEQIKASSIREPEAMALATADARGVPSVRMVLLKEFGEQGFVFYTNYQSRKGREIAENPRAALLFYWAELERQVRIEGSLQKVSSAQSDAYFATRPHGAQISAAVSAQSSEVAYEDLLRAADELEKDRAKRPIPRPAHWGGYSLVPESYEFWQGRVNRLHDRFQYTRGEGGWNIVRLAP